MSVLFKDYDDLERQISDALERSAELAKDIAIKTNTGIVVSKDGKAVTITADELRAERKREASHK